MKRAASEMLGKNSIDSSVIEREKAREAFSSLT